MRKSEHLEFESIEPKSEIKEHLKKCLVCRGASIDNFEIIKKCKSDFDTKVNEALLEKKIQVLIKIYLIPVVCILLRYTLNCLLVIYLT